MNVGFTALIAKGWKKHNRRIGELLSEVVCQLEKLRGFNASLYSILSSSREDSVAFESQTEIIERCLESERQRKVNANICDRAVKSVDAMMDSLMRIERMGVRKESSERLIGLGKGAM